METAGCRGMEARSRGDLTDMEAAGCRGLEAKSRRDLTDMEAAGCRGWRRLQPLKLKL
jgi:hypothetical protein